MSEPMSVKHRVLGTLVLISLAVIFLPMLFSNNDEFFTMRDDFIPTPPDRLKTIIYRLDDDGVFKQESAPAVANTAVAPSSPPVSPATPVTEAAPAEPKAVEVAPVEVEKGNVTPDLPEGLKRWMAQLGSFGQEANAQTLRDKIRQMGYPAYVDRRQSGDQVIWRVRVGPYVSEKEAETVLATLQKKLDLNGLVVRHQ